jgi:cell division protein FtsB
LLTLIFQSALNPIVFLSGVLGILIAPAAALQQHKLTQVEALAQTNERLASEVDQLTAERGRLTASVNSMEESVLK